MSPSNTQQIDTEQFDVIVVGGGPGGSTLGALVALQGHRVLILEKESFPRHQIGESLLPSTVHGICRLTGVADDLAEAGFTVKHGGTFRWGSNPEPWTFSFSVSPKLAGPTSFAYQVERMKFDQILLDNARRQGATVREQCEVTGIIEDGDRVSGVRYRDVAEPGAGTERQATARYVVDASGNLSRLHQAVGGTREYSDFFRNVALYGYFDGGRRLPEPNSGNILSAAFDSGWFWYIPLSPTLTSVGAVVRQEQAARIQGDPERALAELISECPIIDEYLDGAQRITTGVYGQVRTRKDYSYRSTKFWRPGMVLIGDSACFVDPVFSSGVHLATYSALLAARSINSVLTGGLDEQTAFDEFEACYRREYGVFYEFLTAFYDVNASTSAYFTEAKNVTRTGTSELEAFVDLVGGVSSRESTLTSADDISKRIRSRSAEFAAAVNEMSDTDEPNMMPLMRTAVVSAAMRQAAQVQTQAILGEQAGPGNPAMPGGLSVSADGMFWLPPAEESKATSSTVSQ